MLEQFKKNWNIFFSMAIGNLGVANIMLLVEKEHNLSLVVFGIVGVLIGIGALYNQQSQLIKQGDELISLRNQYIEELEQIKREQEIYNRMKEYEEKGDSVLVSKEDAIAGLKVGI